MKNPFIARLFRSARSAAMVLSLLLLGSQSVSAGQVQSLPAESMPALQYLFELAESGNGEQLDVERIAPLLAFLDSPKPQDTLYRAHGSFDAPSAFHQFSLHSSLQRIIDYTLDTDIPSFFFWPSSLRSARWTRVEGGETQFQRLKAASVHLDKPVALEGQEHLSITPDQHTGVYYSYDVDKTIILAPYGAGRLMVSIYRQQRPSVVGKRGWVLGEDNDWSYLYTEDKGVNLKGLKWAKTYIYDSFGITIYWEKGGAEKAVTCGVVSWVKAGWAGMNMVKPHHIKNGLVRVAQAFCSVLENPRLPDPANLAATFARSRDLSTPILRAYARDYFDALERRIASSGSLKKAIGKSFDPNRMLEQMDHDELYATLALDYLKKLLGRDPLIETHPF